VGDDRAALRTHGTRYHPFVAVTAAAALMAGSLLVTASPAAAHSQPAAPARTSAKPAAPLPSTPTTPQPQPAPDAEALTPGQLSSQIKAAATLRAELMRTGAEVAAASSRLERLAAQSNILLANLSGARTAQVDAETVASAQRARLVTLGVEVASSQDSLGRLASDAYIRGGGPLGEMASILGALTEASPEQSTDSLATLQYLMSARARLFTRLRSLRSEQVTTAARAEAARLKAAAAAGSAARAKSELDRVVVDQREALTGFQRAKVAQIGRAAGLRGALLRSEDASARTADRELAQALAGQDFVLLIDKSSSCGKDPRSYPNGRLPASALCPLYAAPGESLAREASTAFNAMSNAYQKHSGSALCVTDSYRSYAEQVAVKLARPGLAAAPGRSQHGFGLAVDFCGGVQSFATPAHLWMQRHAPLYGWFHPGWAEPTGVLPEPWHWEFAH
jgi:zinc D-Ala-D-Ala carboxypeptidase